MASTKPATAAAVAEELAKVQEAMSQSLKLLETEIYIRETAYLNGSRTVGNLMHVRATQAKRHTPFCFRTLHPSMLRMQGWEGITDTKSATIHKSGAEDDSNRIFSASSTSAQKVVPDAKQALRQGSLAAPGPMGHTSGGSAGDMAG